MKLFCNWRCSKFEYIVVCISRQQVSQNGSPLNNISNYAHKSGLDGALLKHFKNRVL